MKSELTSKIGVYRIVEEEEIEKEVSNQSDAVDIIFIGCSGTYNITNDSGKADICKMGLYYSKN